MTRSQPSSAPHPLKPPLKWAGGKRWLISHLLPHWQSQSDRRLVEPFCGGLAVALGLHPQTALLNDINPHAINFYRQLQNGLVIHNPMQNDSDFYYQRRTEFNHLIQSQNAQTPRAAELFYYLNRTGYNGLCRFNQKGGFNVPFGRYKTINYTQDFQPYKPKLAPWIFTNTDFAEIAVKPDDFIYADPPYDVPFRQYSQGGFTWEDQVRLATWLAQHPGPVIVSNQATDRILELYQSLGFTYDCLAAPRRINCTGDRTPAQEMLAFKNIQPLRS